MAEILDWVPANPPRTFHECLQFYWIVEVVGRYMAIVGSGNGIRIDQVWCPYYEADVKADRITRDQALELIECLFLSNPEDEMLLLDPAVLDRTSLGIYKGVLAFMQSSGSGVLSETKALAFAPSDTRY